MRMVFMGTPEFAVPCLHKLIANRYNIVGVVTQPDRPVGRKRVLTPPPVKAAALQYDIPIFQPEKLKEPDSLEQVLALQPDLIVTAAYGQILPVQLLQAPKLGCINVHASLLPKYRGGAPIHRAIIQGEKETGVTIMYMVKALDAGDMIEKVIVPIETTDTMGTLHDKLSTAGSNLLIEILPWLVSGNINPEPQNHAEATYAPNLSREDERMDWTKEATAIYNQVRGLNPSPGAFTVLENEVWKIWRVDVSNDETAKPPGTVLSFTEKGIDVATGKGVITLIEVQPAGKKRMAAIDCIRGGGIRVGVIFDGGMKQ